MKSYLSSVILIIVLTSCQSTQEKKDEVVSSNDSIKNLTPPDTAVNRDCGFLYRQAQRTDSAILNQTNVDLAFANNAIKAFADYAFYCENDSLSPVYLIKAAQIAISINNANQAKIVLDRCISNYPKFKNKPAAIFLMAQLYDEQHLLNNEDEAKKLYEQIIYDYPKSEWAQNAKGAIKLLGKTDEEILKEFEKKNKSKN